MTVHKRFVFLPAMILLMRVLEDPRGMSLHSASASDQASPSVTKSTPRVDLRKLFQQGQTALQEGDLATAESAFRQVLAIDPRAGGAYANLGVIKMRRKEWDQAISLLRKAEKLEPRITGIRLNIGLVEYRRANYAQAIPPLESVVKEQPESTQARYLLGLCYTFVQKYADAVQTLDPLWAQMSGQFVYLYVLGNAAHFSGHEVLDRKAMARLVEIGSDTPEFHLMMGKALLNHDDDQRALEELQRAAAGNPQLPFLHFHMGLVYRRLGQSELAEREFLKDIELEPDVGYNYEQLGKLYLHLGRDAEAEQAFQQALKQEPRLPSSLVELAKIHLRRGDLGLAIKEADAAKGLSPESQSVRFVRGQILQRTGRTKEAKAEFDSARKLMAAGVERERSRKEEPVPDPDIALQP
jgi:Flp pilus assembly protein TadD